MAKLQSIKFPIEVIMLILSPNKVIILWQSVQFILNKPLTFVFNSSLLDNMLTDYS